MDEIFASPILAGRWFVRDFGSIVRIDLIEVSHRGYDRTMSRIITSEFIGDHPARFTSLVLEKTAERDFIRRLIATAYPKNINSIVALIRDIPQVLALPLNGDKEFVDMPRIA